MSSRVIIARLLLGVAGDRLPCGKKRSGDFFLSVVSVYAPTSKATYAVKSQFMADLQSAIEQVPASDVLVVLGDFNARVGARPAVRNETDDVSRVDGVGDSQFAWGQAVGRFGLGVRNPGKIFCCSVLPISCQL